MPKPKHTNKPLADYTDEDIARRRDEVIRRMANTPPQPRVTSPNPKSGKRKQTGQGRAAPKRKAERKP
jgi:hypothetical protein